MYSVGTWWSIHKLWGNKKKKSFRYKIFLWHSTSLIKIFCCILATSEDSCSVCIYFIYEKWSCIYFIYEKWSCLNSLIISRNAFVCQQPIELQNLYLKYSNICIWKYHTLVFKHVIFVEISYWNCVLVLNHRSRVRHASCLTLQLHICKEIK